MRTYLAAALILFAVSTTIAQDDPCKPQVPDRVKGEIRHLEDEARDAETQGETKRASELRAQAKKLAEEEQARDKRLGEILAAKDLRAEAGVLLLHRTDKERLTHEFFSYMFGLNLINGLQLTDDQMKKILASLREKRKALRDEDWNTALRGFLAVKDMLEKDRRTSKDAIVLFLKSEGLFMELSAQPDGAREKALAKLTAGIEAFLSDGQKEIIRTYIPCHLPYEDLDNPERVGQADAATHGIRILEDARGIPAREFLGWFDHVLMPFIEQRVEMLRKNPQPGFEADVGAERTRILKLLYRARSKPDVEFELTKKDLAKELHLEVDPPQPELGPEAIPERIRAFLLDTRFIPLFERRLGMKPEAPAPAKLPEPAAPGGT
ncbi:MAG: hypothetical protein ACYTAF_02475 [Planctomycetota bacterium]|jgi:hypothetical protein